MSTTFATMGLLVLAGFALGLLVGWLAWRPTHPASTEPEPTPRPGQTRRRPMTQGLPDWQVRELPAGEGPLVEPRSMSWPQGETADPTVVIGSETFGPDPSA